jgi:hypothetical protein
MTEAGDVIKSGAVEKIADLVNKLAGPLADEVGMMLGDKVKVYRVKNWIKTVEKTERLLREAKLPVNAVPPRLFLPIMEASSIEDNETLQDMWAGLLASASQDTDTVSPSFVETLKQLTPREAKYLQRLHDDALEKKRKMFTDDKWKEIEKRHPELSSRRKSVAHWPVPNYAFPLVQSKSEKQTSSDTYERLGLIQRMYDVNNKPSGEDALTDSEYGYATIYQAELVFQFEFTKYADRFMQACQGPSAGDRQ